MKRTALGLTQPGWAILASVMILLSMGIASIYVTDTHYVVGHDGPRNAVKQCVFAFAGMILAAVIWFDIVRPHKPQPGFPFAFNGRTFRPPGTRGWRTTKEGMTRAMRADRFSASSKSLSLIRYAAEA
ncbi:MAG: hypothetical protein IH987_22160, partial [Planctomycetes bacterium]|nr:hypothetical protein [Planctomycetota bacterium]